MDEKGLDLIQFNRNPDLLLQVVEQIKKDFGMFAIGIEFSGDPKQAYAELFGQLHAHLKTLEHSNKQKFISILYRVDLSEQQIAKAMQQHPSDTFTAIVADLILKRELQKVILRNQSKYL